MTIISIVVLVTLIFFGKKLSAFLRTKFKEPGEKVVDLLSISATMLKDGAEVLMAKVHGQWLEEGRRQLGNPKATIIQVAFFYDEIKHADAMVAGFMVELEALYVEASKARTIKAAEKAAAKIQRLRDVIDNVDTKTKAKVVAKVNGKGRAKKKS